MFYVLSKTLDWFLSPLSWSLLLGIAAFLLMRKKRGIAVVCGLVALVNLWLFSIDPVSNGLWRLLEGQARSTMRPNIEYDAVIVLSGMVDGTATQAHGQPAYNDNIERLLTGFQLLRDGRAKNVLLSGGYSVADGSGPKEADVLAKQLRDWGVEPARIVEERESRNTRENATNSARIVAEKNWKSLLLVTSAFHMPRALAACEQAGLKPDVLPVDYRVGPAAFGWVPRAGNLDTSTSALRELAGRVVYRIVGYAR